MSSIMYKILVHLVKAFKHDYNFNRNTFFDKISDHYNETF